MKPKKHKSRPKRKPVHDNIRRLRMERGMTQAELGEATGDDKTVVSHWERALSSPRTEKLPRVADALGVTVDELLASAA